MLLVDPVLRLISAKVEVLAPMPDALHLDGDFGYDEASTMTFLPMNYPITENLPTLTCVSLLRIYNSPP
jgi:hypothetical protein